MYSRIIRSRCFCQLTNIRYILIRKCSGQTHIGSIDEIFNKHVAHGEYESINIGSNLSPDINAIIFKLNTTNSMNDELLNQISKFLTFNNYSISKDTTLLLDTIAIKISNKLTYYEPTKIYSLIINILQKFVNNHRIPNKECIESMITILLSLDSSKINHCISKSLYSLLQFATTYNPVSFKTYVNVIEYVSIQTFNQKK
eukprot:32419_1